jgi:hypothetical protein
MQFLFLLTFLFSSLALCAPALAPDLERRGAGLLKFYHDAECKKHKTTKKLTLFPQEECYLATTPYLRVSDLKGKAPC